MYNEEVVFSNSARFHCPIVDLPHYVPEEGPTDHKQPGFKLMTNIFLYYKSPCSVLV